MLIRFPLLPIEFEFIARRRTGPFRFRVRTLLIATSLAAVITYLFLPLSAADRRLMAIYEYLGSPNFSDERITKKWIIAQIGPPSSAEVPSMPNEAPGYTWVATFEKPLRYQRFELGLSFSGDSDEDFVTAQGLQKEDYQGLELIWFRVMNIVNKLNL
jgi:hypothetical protein